MRKACRWLNILISIVIGAAITALGLIGALNDLNIIFFVILGLAILSLAFAAYYALRKDLLRVDMKCQVIAAFIALAASVMGISVDLLTLFELPILFVAASAITLVIIVNFKFIKFITRRGGC
jgi:hypothetical protein